MTTSIRDLASLGGLTRAAMYDGREVTQKARDAFRASFLDGHQCRVCPSISIPTELPPAERQRRADALFAAHYTRIRMARRAKKAPSAAESESAQEVSDVHGITTPTVRG